IFIDSYGGQVYQCFGLLSVMKASKTEIHTIVTGAAMSCGFMMLISGHKRYAYSLSTPLYHQVSSVAWGKLKDMEEDVQETKRLQKIIEDITYERTNITRKRLKEVFKGKKDWFMSADEALRLGVVDEILTDIPV
ncbi:MAG: ClpP family protease, partial [Candidatus Thorarchaeota archaeon]